MSEQRQGRFSFVIGFISGMAAAYTAHFVYSNDKGVELRSEFSKHWQEAKQCCSKVKDNFSASKKKAKKIPQKRGSKPGVKKKKKKIKKFKGI